MTQIIFLAIAVLLVQVKGQTVLISNCTSYDKYQQGGHNNVPDLSDCRRFYSCNNRGEGFQTQCGAGTIFNYALGSCSTGIDCTLWRNLACFDNLNRFTPGTVRRFPGLCCKNYYSYTCPPSQDMASAWEFRQCADGQVFNPSAQQCEAPSQNIQLTCPFCPPAASAAPVGCEGTHITVLDDCTFFQGNFSTDVKKCSPGTKMDKSICRCDLADTTGVCTPKDNCMTRSLFNLPETVFGGDHLYPSDKNPTNAVYQIPFFSGNGMSGGEATQTFTIGFTINPNTLNSEATILSQTCQSASGISITLKVRKDSFNGISLRYEAVNLLPGQSTSVSTISSIPFSLSSSDRVTTSLKFAKSTNPAKRSFVGTYQVNQNQINTFTNNGEIDFQYWAAFKPCAMSLGNVDNLFTQAGGAITRFTYTACKIQ